MDIFVNHLLKKYHRFHSYHCYRHGDHYHCQHCQPPWGKRVDWIGVVYRLLHTIWLGRKGHYGHNHPSLYDCLPNACNRSHATHLWQLASDWWVYQVSIADFHCNSNKTFFYFNEFSLFSGFIVIGGTLIYRERSCLQSKTDVTNRAF